MQATAKWQGYHPRHCCIRRNFFIDKTVGRPPRNGVVDILCPSVRQDEVQIQVPSRRPSLLLRQLDERRPRNNCIFEELPAFLSRQVRKASMLRPEGADGLECQRITNSQTEEV